MRYSKGATPKGRRKATGGEKAAAALLGLIMALAILIRLGLFVVAGWGIYELVHWLVTTK